MNIAQIVRNGPAMYHAGRGILKHLPALISPFKSPIIVTGEKSYHAFVKHYGEPPYPVYRYDKTASLEDMQRIADAIGAENSDLIIGIGGGKVLDTAKGVAENLKAEIMFIPTVIGTCACATPIAAVYHPDHSFRSVGYFHRSGYLTLADYDLLIESPREYFLSGISDTLAKWYEIEALTRKFERLPAMVCAARATAAVTRDILERDTEKALQAMAEQTFHPAFADIVDSIFQIAATVGCFGCDNGRSAGAHAIHNALTIYPETHAIQHGIKVAYGILVQLIATGDEAEIERLLPYYRNSGFIYQFAQLGISEPIELASKKIAEIAASEKETFRYIQPFSADDIQQAILQLECLTADFFNKV
ncbi:iron-containing alcohol dehydrogenase family protein [Suttonella ornithocola]|uniref:Glycerol dehydrogenase n=1 Tax=Suttonella ornithocola TaxID=279832 RepID=A0A380MPC3_9GAMM|nr:iron-containing alcohol dehydrogenase family protein [Suttonella ornithocola]SUO94469.1 Glycerol dehydrogenase [Suttonella ornithocola]